MIDQIISGELIHRKDGPNKKRRGIAPAPRSVDRNA